MKKARILIWLGSLTFLAGVLLENFTSLPRYLSPPLLLLGLAGTLWGSYEARRSQDEHKPLSRTAKHRAFAILLLCAMIGCLGTLYFNKYSNVNLPFGTQLIIALVTLAMCIGILYWRIYRRPVDTGSNGFPKRWLALGAVALICFVLAEVFAILDRDNKATREVNRQLSVALKAWEGKQPGIERADELVRRLRAIDTRNAPADVRIAISEYAKALDDALNVYRSGRQAVAAAIYDPIIAEKKNALDQALKKHL